MQSEAVSRKSFVSKPAVLCGLLLALTLVGCKNSRNQAPQVPQKNQTSNQQNPFFSNNNTNNTSPNNQNTNQNQSSYQSDAEPCRDLDDCPKVSFDTIIDNEENVEVEGSSLTFSLGERADFDLKIRPRVNLNGREFSYFVSGFPRDGDVDVDEDTIRLQWNPDDRDSGSFEVIVRDMDLCLIRYEDDDDGGEERCEDESRAFAKIDQSFVYTYFAEDPSESPEARIAAARERQEESEKAARTVDCISDTAQAIVGDEGIVGDITNIASGALKVLIGGAENADADCQDSN